MWSANVSVQNPAKCPRCVSTSDHHQHCRGEAPGVTVQCGDTEPMFTAHFTAKRKHVISVLSIDCEGRGLHRVHCPGDTLVTPQPHTALYW